MTSKEVKKGRQGPINEFNEQIILLSLARFAKGQEFLLTEAFPFIPNLFSQTIFASEEQTMYSCIQNYERFAVFT